MFNSLKEDVSDCKYKIKQLETYVNGYKNGFTGRRYGGLTHNMKDMKELQHEVRDKVSREEFNALLEHLFVELEKVPAEPSKFVVKEKGE